MNARYCFVVAVVLGSSLSGLGANGRAVAQVSNVCAGTGTATFLDSAVWYPAAVPGGLGADPAPGANSGTFGVSGACTGGGSSLSGSFVFPRGAQCGRSAGGSGSIDGTGETFSIDTLGTVVLIAGEVTGVADATPLTGTSCRADQGGTKNFTLAGAVVVNGSGSATPTGRRCNLQSATNPAAPGQVQAGELNAGPIGSPGATAIVLCTVQVGPGGGTHNGPDAASAGADGGGGFAVLPPTPVSYAWTAGEAIHLCTQVTVNGDTYYWDGAIDRWALSNAVACEATFRQQVAPVPGAAGRHPDAASGGTWLVCGGSEDITVCA